MQGRKASLESNIQNYYIDKSLFITSNSSYAGEKMKDGLDYQGIQWNVEMKSMSRDLFRKLRATGYKPLRQFKGNEVTQHPLKKTKDNEPYYTFERFYKAPKLPAQPSQSKYTLISPNKTDLLYPYTDGFVHHSLLEFKENKIFIEPELNPTSIDSHGNLVALATSKGKLILYNMKDQYAVYNSSPLNNIYANNAVSLFQQEGSSVVKLACGGNEHSFQVYNVDINVQLIYKETMGCTLNAVRPSPDGNLLMLLKAQTAVEIFDLRAGKTIIKLKGHQDYGTSGDWHPNGMTVATGNQDCTCRIWDLRRPSQQIDILQARLGSVSNVKYSKTGSHLVMSENIDYVNIYNADNDYKEVQVVDFFGENAGLCFDGEDGNNLYFAVLLKGHNGIFEYKLRESNIMQSLSNFMF